MFCDLAGSTALAGQLDPEELNEVMQEYHSLCAEVVERHAGRIAQFLGDGLLVYFGYPLAHEDDAQRAVRAGLEIVAAVSSAREGLRKLLQVRIAVHTGLVVVGQLGGETNPDPMAISGETPNIAARLQSIAEPGQVVVSAATYRLIEGFFRCRSLGTPALKGVGTPIEAFEVVEPTGIYTRFEHALTSGLTPFIGREEEVEELLDCWREAREGRGQIVMLSGEAGIGKSRLVQELIRRSAGESVWQLRCRCSPYYQDSALYPAIEFLQKMLGFSGGDNAQDKVAKLEQALAVFDLNLPETVPLFAALLSLPGNARYPAPPMTPQRQKQKTFVAIVEWLMRCAERGPTRLVVEDLHWADPFTLELVEFLIERVPAASFLLILVFRPEFVPPWRSRLRTTNITVGHLSSTATDLMIHSVAGGKSLPAELTREIIAKTEGVPLFIEELTRMLLESNLMEEQIDRYVLTSALRPLAIPSTLHDSLMARLDQLGTAKEVAQLAAIIGREFSYDLLRALSPLEETRLTGALNRLVDAELITQRAVAPQTSYRFRHALIHDAAYESLLRSERKEIHQLAGRAIESMYGGQLEDHLGELAHHYSRADNVSEGVKYLGLAARREIAKSAYESALQQLTTARELISRLAPGTERDRIELDLLIDYGVTLLVLKGFYVPELGEVYQRAAILCKQLGEHHRLMPVLYGLASFHLCRAELKLARRHIEEMRSVPAQSNDAITILSAWLMGNAQFFMGGLADAHHQFEEAIAIYDRSTHRNLAVQSGQDPCVSALVYDAMALLIMGFADQAEHRLAAAISLARELDHPFTLTVCLLTAANYLCIRRDFKRLPEVVAETSALARENGFAFYEESIKAFEVIGLAFEGRIDEFRVKSRFSKRFSELRYELALTWAQSTLAEALASLGLVTVASSLLSDAIAKMNRNDERFVESEIQRIRGVLTLRQLVGCSPSSEETIKAHAQAEQAFRDAHTIASRRGAKLFALRASASLATLLTDTPRRQEGQELLNQCLSSFTEGFDSPDLIEARAVLERCGAVASSTV
jgi:class 3 adenylate cyclase